MDREGWPPGPWDGEPDKLEWRSGGYPCLIVRSPGTGALCGYVGVAPGHPWYGKGFGELDCEVHGGLTYANTGCVGHICHVPEPGEGDLVHWLGFDCSHFQDISPVLEAAVMRVRMPRLLFGFETYKEVAYVRAEVERLREQAEAARVEANRERPFPEWPEE